MCLESERGEKQKVRVSMGEQQKLLSELLPLPLIHYLLQGSQKVFKQRDVA